MSSTSSNAWAVWVIIILLLITCIGIIIWFAIDSYNASSITTECAPLCSNVT